MGRSPSPSHTPSKAVAFTNYTDCLVQMNLIVVIFLGLLSTAEATLVYPRRPLGALAARSLKKILDTTPPPPIVPPPQFAPLVRPLPPPAIPPALPPSSPYYGSWYGQDWEDGCDPLVPPIRRRYPHWYPPYYYPYHYGVRGWKGWTEAKKEIISEIEEAEDGTSE